MDNTLETTCIQNIAHSDYKAFSDLYDNYWDLLLSVALKKTGDIDISMDIVQDLFVDIWQRRSTLSNIEMFENTLLPRCILKCSCTSDEKAYSKSIFPHTSSSAKMRRKKTSYRCWRARYSTTVC